ncbi:MAG: FecR domain-containing protein [Elusimicrobia bacterium]|nr:FecR domain-containing protein [Elusimicrobiota bacterium]
MLRLMPHSQFSLDQASPKLSLFTLTLGKLTAVLRGLFSSNVRIRTTTAVIAVRGTAFEVSAGERSTEVALADGTLEVEDGRGRRAVLSSEETLRIGPGGMGTPKLLSLSDRRSQAAARPAAVLRETARDLARSVIEETRNRELKANEAQFGKDAIDAFGRRVRVEEYLLRPAANEFKLVFLNRREGRFDWGHLIERFNGAIPDDLAQVPAIVAGTYLSRTQPANWLKYLEVYLTNATDSLRETVSLGDPVLINMSGYGAGVGSRWYPVTSEFVQTLYGPGVPGGSRVQFRQTQDWNLTAAGRFTWKQEVRRDTGALDVLTHADLDPTIAADVTQGWTTILPDDKWGDPTIDPGDPAISFPSGSGKADLASRTDYRDGSWVSVEKILVSNDGKVLDFKDVTSAAFDKEGGYNLEIVAKSGFFQGRDIDVLIAPEILAQKRSGAATADALKP